MSRAFVSENDTDAAADLLPELPQSRHPNYVTARGLRLLEERLAAAQEHQRGLAVRPDDPAKELELAHTAREIRYLEARIERAIPVDPTQAPADEVAFGAVVQVTDSAGDHHEFAIVGEDEADAEHGKVSWVSPLARALIGAGVGDVVLWRRPAGEAELEIRAIRYPEREA
jgi:transcription elongation GreA/GreB family factor